MILYAIETTTPTGEKYAELWRTYDHYGDVSLVFGVKLEDYEKKQAEFNKAALRQAFDHYINKEVDF